MHVGVSSLVVESEILLYEGVELVHLHNIFFVADYDSHGMVR
jgi:hypothetical protein